MTIKHSNRGGFRPGAGRPTKAQQEARAAAEPKASSADVTSAPIKLKVDGKNVKLDVVSEIAKIYLELSNKSLGKDERAELKDRVAILKELLPYSTKKQAVASLQENNQKATTITIKDVNFKDDGDDGGIV